MSDLLEALKKSGVPTKIVDVAIPISAQSSRTLSIDVDDLLSFVAARGGRRSRRTRDVCLLCSDEQCIHASGLDEFASAQRPSLKRKKPAECFVGIDGSSENEVWTPRKLSVEQVSASVVEEVFMNVSAEPPILAVEEEPLFPSLQSGSDNIMEASLGIISLGESQLNSKFSESNFLVSSSEAQQKDSPKFKRTLMDAVKERLSKLGHSSKLLSEEPIVESENVVKLEKISEKSPVKAEKLEETVVERPLEKTVQSEAVKCADETGLGKGRKETEIFEALDGKKKSSPFQKTAGHSRPKHRLPRAVASLSGLVSAEYQILD